LLQISITLGRIERLLGQEFSMYVGISSRTGFVSLIALMALLFGGCDSPATDQTATVSAEAQRDNANGEAQSPGGENPIPAADVAPARPVVSQTMAYAELKNELVYGYFSAPADMFEPLPAVIMIHDWWGLNDQIRATADRLAGEGFIVLAVDLFGSKVASTPGEARVLTMEAIEDLDSLNDNIRAAFDFVSNTAGAPRVGSLGWGFGGSRSLRVAELFPEELDAAVIYYGQVDDDEESLLPIGAPILALFAANDASIRVASVEAFRGALESLRKNFDLHIYPDVGRGFFEPSGRNFDAAIAADAWRRTLEFLNLHLTINESD
jgi:carboxymethylenebutenolidase